ncbi:MAG: putative lipid II flippase FtsW [Acidimicrobiales bacterium]
MTTTTFPPARIGAPTRRTTTKAADTRERTRVGDGSVVLLLAVLSVLTLVGLVMVLSASSVVALEQRGSPYYYFLRQAMWLGGGLLVFLLTFYVDYRRWRRWSLPVLALSIVLLLLVFVPGLGVDANGSSRWLGYGGFGIQPSELAKLGMLLFTADLLARRRHLIADARATLHPVLIVFGFVALLILVQPNLGTTIVLAAIVFAMLFASGVPLAPLGGYGIAGAALATTLAFAKSYRRARLLAFLHPWDDPLGIGYQNIQSQVSLASGGWFGVGLGASRAKWGFLPYAHTDFIFAIIGEELGLVGALLVVGLFVGLGILGVRTALLAADPFGRLLAVGITTWFCVQAFVNIGAVIRVLPITGVPLPFVSFGGSSLLATMAAAGVLCNVARHGRETARRA